ncbi:MAG UNVERIFIED_CONTAM: hypothetical protein LVR29_05185 [Microcystis novacekii LVE1205-3]|jgi:hypothetical protein
MPNSPASHSQRSGSHWSFLCISPQGSWVPVSKHTTYTASNVHLGDSHDSSLKYSRHGTGPSAGTQRSSSEENEQPDARHDPDPSRPRSRAPDKRSPALHPHRLSAKQLSTLSAQHGGLALVVLVVWVVVMVLVEVQVELVLVGVVVGLVVGVVGVVVVVVVGLAVLVLVGVMLHASTGPHVPNPLPLSMNLQRAGHVDCEEQPARRRTERAVVAREQLRRVGAWPSRADVALRVEAAERGALLDRQRNSAWSSRCSQPWTGSRYR